MTGIKNNIIVEEPLISFETAKLAKEKGFNEVSSACFDINGKSHFGINHKNDLGGSVYSSPTQALLQKWLRERLNINVYCIPTKYDANIWLHNFLGDNVETIVGTYEEVLEKGLQEALKLIQS